jgi:pimeloyl-ACP methyl ester carboxylesterase
VRAALAPCFPLAVRELARCGTVWVFEDRARGAGPRIPLRVVVLPARRHPAAPDPVVFLTGGPGLGAAAAPRYALNALGAIRDGRDLVLVDQRGTGGSRELDCDVQADGGRLQPHAGPAFPLEGVRRCRAALGARADLRHYTTAHAADDLADVLTALGYRRANLLGVSYGSRAALVFLRRHPARVRAAVLHGVVSPEAVIPLAAGWAGGRALAAQAAACAAETPCRDSFPDPAADLRAALDRLEQAPVRVTLWNWRRLRREEVLLTRRGVAERAWSMLYHPWDGRRMLGLVHRAAAGDWEPMAREAVAGGRGRTARRSMGLMLSVLCAEDAPRLAAADTAAAARGSPLGLPMAHELLRACALWPPAAAPLVTATPPAASDVPVLLLSGGRDPVTPPEWGDSARATLTTSAHLVVPRAGHAELDDCVRGAIRAFLAAGTPNVVPTACAREPSARPVE